MIMLLLISFVSFAAAQNTAASAFAVIASQGVTSTGNSVVTGGVAVSPGSSITGFPPATLTGATEAATTAAANAKASADDLYAALAALPCSANNTNVAMSGVTITPGTYCFSTGVQIDTTLTLDGQGNPNAVFVFQIAQTLTTASSSSVNLIGQAQNCGVFWQIGSSATLGSGSVMRGTLSAYASISTASTSTSYGSLHAKTASVTMIGSTVLQTISCPAIVIPGQSGSAASISAFSALLLTTLFSLIFVL